jgi:hypothetical protein
MTSKQPKRFCFIHQDMEYQIGTWVMAMNPFTGNMAIPVMEFQVWGYKIIKIFIKNQHTLRKLLKFEIWCSQISGIILLINKLMLSKNVNKTNVLLNWYFSMKKNEKNFNDI